MFLPRLNIFALGQSSKHLYVAAKCRCGVDFTRLMGFQLVRYMSSKAPVPLMGLGKGIQLLYVR